MKRTLCKVILAAAIAVLPAMGANAQPRPQRGPGEGFKGQPMEMPSVEEMAQQKTDMMNHELRLTEKQYKKIYKYYKKQIQKERDMMEENRPEGMPEGFPGGGRPDFGGGRPPMNGAGGGFPGGGRPGAGFPGGGPQAGGPQMNGGRPPMGGPGAMVSDEEMEKFYAKQDKKLQKILTAEQYSRWRAKHPADRLPMPKFELK